MKRKLLKKIFMISSLTCGSFVSFNVKAKELVNDKML